MKTTRQTRTPHQDAAKKRFEIASYLHGVDTVRGMMTGVVSHPRGLAQRLDLSSGVCTDYAQLAKDLEHLAACATSAAKIAREAAAIVKETT